VVFNFSWLRLLHAVARTNQSVVVSKIQQIIFALKVEDSFGAENNNSDYKH
jgi:hypothetical protein